MFPVARLSGGVLPHRTPASIVVLGLLIGAGALLAGCRDRTVEVSLDAAIEFADERVGTGPAAQEGYLVEVHYAARLPEGKLVLNTRDRGRSHSFVVGDGTVIPGMDAAVRGMRGGGMRIVTLPPHAHYGRMGYAGVIPPETVLTFEIEMLRVSRTGDSPLAWTNAPER